jgi:hypothetical protein
MKLDIACGSVKEDGWVGMDQAALPGVDIVCDLLSFPWPIEDGAVDEIHCTHFLEHVPARLRPAFFNEVWRILKLGGMAGFITPLGLYRQAQDFTHEWPPIVPGSYFYFSKEWLERCNLIHYRDCYGITCNFAVADIVIQMCAGYDDMADEARERLIQETPSGPGDLVVFIRKLEA